jgi:hypothetical protein
MSGQEKKSIPRLEFLQNGSGHFTVTEMSRWARPG